MTRTTEARQWGAMLTVRETAARLNLSRDSVYTLILSGALAAAKIGTPRGRRGGRYLIPEAAIAEWLSRAVRAEGR